MGIRIERATIRLAGLGVAAMLLLDDGWPDDLLMLGRQESLQVEGRESFLLELKGQITRLRSAPLVDVEQFVSSCRDVRASSRRCAVGSLSGPMIATKTWTG